MRVQRAERFVAVGSKSVCQDNAESLMASKLDVRGGEISMGSTRGLYTAESTRIAEVWLYRGQQRIRSSPVIGIGDCTGSDRNEH